MRDLLLVVAGLISTAAYICVIVFVIQATRKDNDRLYRMLNSSGIPRYTFSDKVRYFVTKWYLLLALFGFIVCIGVGTYYFLWWLPNSWGHFDDEGSWVTLRSSLAGLSALFVGGPLAFLVAGCVESKNELKQALHELSVMRRMIEDDNKETQWYESLAKRGSYDDVRFDSDRSNLERQLNNLERPATGDYRELERYQRLRESYMTRLAIVKDKVRDSTTQ
jgi:hypothetical protein